MLRLRVRESGLLTPSEYQNDLANRYGELTYAEILLELKRDLEFIKRLSPCLKKFQRRKLTNERN